MLIHIFVAWFSTLPTDVISLEVHICDIVQYHLFKKSYFVTILFSLLVLQYQIWPTSSLCQLNGPWPYLGTNAAFVKKQALSTSDIDICPVL